MYVSGRETLLAACVCCAVPTESCAEGGQASTKAAVPTHHRRTPFLLPSRIRGGKGGSLEEITNKIFDDLMKGKSELAHTFDDLGVVDLERSKV